MDAAAAAADAASTAAASEPKAPTPEEIAAAEQKEAQEAAHTEALIEKVFVAFNGDVGVSQVRTLGETAEAMALLREAATYMTESLLPRLALEMHERESPIWDSSVIRDTVHSTCSLLCSVVPTRMCAACPCLSLSPFFSSSPSLSHSHPSHHLHQAAVPTCATWAALPN